MAETTPASLIVRRARAKDFVKIREYLTSSTTHLSLLHPSPCEMEVLTVPSDEAVDLGEDRLYVVEASEKIIGHFFICELNEQDKWVQVTGAFIGDCEEKEARAACRLFFDIMLQQKHIHKIILTVNPEACLFFKLARSLGLFLEGTLRKHIFLSGVWRDLCLFSLLAGDTLARDLSQSKDAQHDWLLERARYDEVDVFVVRAVILRMQPKCIEVLLLRRTQNVALPGVEETPGGKMLPQETILQALSREVKEAIAVDIEKEVTFLTSFDFTNVDGKRVREFVFRVKPLSWDIKPDKEEYGSFCWLSLQELPKSRLHPDMVQILASYSPKISYETELCPAHEGEASIELFVLLQLSLKRNCLQGFILTLTPLVG